MNLLLVLKIILFVSSLIILKKIEILMKIDRHLCLKCMSIALWKGLVCSFMYDFYFYFQKMYLRPTPTRKSQTFWKGNLRVIITQGWLLPLAPDVFVNVRREAEQGLQLAADFTQMNC